MTFDGRLFSGITVLAAVAESGSFVRAADALGLSPSGVSRAVSRLEKRVGVRLLDRTTRSQTMTDEGRRLYESVVPHLTGIEEAASAASGSANVVQGKLRVNVDPFFSRTVLASRLPDFLAHHPDLSLELIMRDDVGDLVADGFDLAVRFGPWLGCIRPEYRAPRLPERMALASDRNDGCHLRLSCHRHLVRQ